MIWYIIIPVIVFTVVYRIIRSDSYSQESVWYSVGFGLLWGIIAGGIAATLTGALLGSFLPSEEKLQGQLKIVALADATHIDGGFYLFGGSIDSEPVYRYYYRSDNGYRMGWKKVEDSLIVESETETPRYEKYEDAQETNWWGIGVSGDPHYIFYVPPGTVTNAFELDLEG